jgi:hypothetical protein
MPKPFDLEDYSAVVAALDKVLEVFRETTETEEKAELAMQNFVLAHYFPVWRAIN